ncbi:MFS general substrate transporter [Coniophora puteana RWD-64-598 SS2]|uniref:MFS general substrate transporter n=1 Tax=Coniophora puteana (strain RWD-64-598) TaxID=741705 RepID=A0A5M3MT82_CONPW|nr:MFS general substrate transporter [Coniophora puteana RWD-64-598 SS2]EIW81731.1 MFS general substrate transporter [Coniophora puteana RWD-64-598 SS2]
MAIDLGTGPSRLVSIARLTTLVGSVIVALGSGTNYIYSAYAPQLGARLHASHTQLNIIGLAGNVGVYSSGPIWGKLVDARGPRLALIGAFASLLVGYLGIKHTYDNGEPETEIEWHVIILLVVCGFLTGMGGNAGLAAGMNTTAKSFPEKARATTTALVLSGFGLSAFFFSTLAHALWPGNTSSLLLLLALGTSLPMLLGLLIVRRVPVPPSRPASVAGYARGETEGPNIYGKRLWMTGDFYLIFAIMGLLSGTGLMYINNVGSISQALYAKGNPTYDDLEAAKWQAAQVSTLSIGNFSGRVLIGLISDVLLRLKLPRASALSIVSALFIVSQIVALQIEDVSHLWRATVVLGLTYGGLFGVMPTIVIEWFGLAHLSENWGYTSLSPLVGGNLFSLMFGRMLDAHDDGSAPSSSTPAPDAVLHTRAGLPSEHQCFDGRACYADSLRITTAACCLALALSIWAGVRDARKRRAGKAVGGG